MKLRSLVIGSTIAAAAIVLLSGRGNAAENTGGDKLNVIFLLIDDLGWTDVGCFGSDLYETPNIDRLAREGMRFTNGYSACTVCSPTRSAVMTGKYPARLHITDWISGHKRPYAKLQVPDWTMHLPHAEVTVAEALKPLSYSTTHIGKWHLGPEGYWPTDQGFDVNIAGCHAGSPPSYYWPYSRDKGNNKGIPTLKLTKETEGQYLTDRLADEAAAAIRANKDRPFYLYLPTYQVHTPIQPKKEYVAKYEAKIKPGMRHTNANYAAMVQSMDELVGKVLRTLDELKIADKTVVFFTGDNGGLSHTKGGPTNNAPLRAGKGSTFEGGVRVPLVVRWPGVVRPGSVCEEPVLSIDYYPTILEITGVKGDAKHNASVDGLSLVSLLKAPQGKLDRDAIYWHYPHYHPGGATPYGAIRARDWKLVEFYEDNRVELYNLKEDIGEQNDLAAKMPEKAKELRERLHAWRSKVCAQMPTPNPDYNPAKEKPKK